MKNSDKYLKWVEWSDEDQCYIGRCPELFMGGVHGEDEIQVYRQLTVAIEEALGEEEGKIPDTIFNREYSGKFMVRMDPDEHKALVIRAYQSGVSLNEYVVNASKTGVLS